MENGIKVFEVVERFSVLNTLKREQFFMLTAIGLGQGKL